MATYLIVGTSSGIGAALKQILTEAEHKVYSISRSGDAADAGHFALDVLQDSLPVIDEPLQGIAYCPGSINLKPFRSLKYDDFKNDWEINFWGAVKVLLHYQPNLQKSPGAAVVLFSTVAVSMGMPYHASVAGAKGSLEGLVRSLAAEWAPKIRVNAIAPSLTDTPLAGRLLDTDAKRTASAERHPLKAIGNSKDIAALAAYLLGSNAAFITGQVIHADGGISSVKL